MRKNLILLLCSILISAGIAEVVVANLRPAPFIFPISTSSENGDHSLSLNPRLIYVPRPNSGEFNGRGQRGRETPYERTAGTRRVVCMGDSVLEGLGVAWEQRFTELLATRLGAGYEIVNLGVRGYNLQQEIDYFRQEGLRYQPDLVVFGITYNDLEIHSGEIYALNDDLMGTGQGEFYGSFYRHKQALGTYLLRFHVYRYFYLWWMGRRARVASGDGSFLDTVYYRLTDPQIEEILSDLQGVSAEHKVKPLFVFLPFLYEDSQMRLLRDWVGKSGMPFVDLFEEVHKKYEPDDQNPLFLDACHLSHAGHAYVAERLAEVIPAMFQ
jgi:lysophospholipase L1-like esterase